jgi:hypothetical protein
MLQPARFDIAPARVAYPLRGRASLNIAHKLRLPGGRADSERRAR